MNLSYIEILKKHKDQLDEPIKKIIDKKNNRTRGKGYDTMRKARTVQINRRSTKD